MATCTMEGCQKPVMARGWCSTHYQRWQRHGDPNGGRHYKPRASRRPAPCLVEACGRPARSRGMCEAHYARWRKTGDPGPAELRAQPFYEGMTEKRCTACGETKPLEEFHRVSRPGRYVARCKTCRARETARHQRKRLYGLTDQQFQRMVLEQAGRCAICDGESPLCVDHDHSTGRVRKLICDPCNKALGMAREDPRVLRRMAEYIEAHKDF